MNHMNSSSSDWISAIYTNICSSPKALESLISEYEERIIDAEGLAQHSVLLQAQMLQLRQALARETERRLEIERAFEVLSLKLNYDHYGVKQHESPRGKLPSLRKVPNDDVENLNKLVTSLKAQNKKLFASVSSLEEDLVNQKTTATFAEDKCSSLAKQLSLEKIKNRNLEAEIMAMKSEFERTSMLTKKIQEESSTGSEKEIQMLKTSLQKMKEQLQMTKKQLQIKVSEFDELQSTSTQKIEGLEHKITQMSDDHRDRGMNNETSLKKERERFVNLRNVFFSFFHFLADLLSSSTLKYDGTVKCNDLIQLDTMGEFEFSRLCEGILHAIAGLNANQGVLAAVSNCVVNLPEQQLLDSLQDVVSKGDFILSQHYDDVVSFAPAAEKSILQDLAEKNEALKETLREVEDAQQSYKFSKHRPKLMTLPPKLKLAIDRINNVEKICAEKIRIYKYFQLIDRIVVLRQLCEMVSPGSEQRLKYSEWQLSVTAAPSVPQQQLSNSLNGSPAPSRRRSARKNDVKTLICEDIVSLPTVLSQNSFDMSDHRPIRDDVRRRKSSSRLDSSRPPSSSTVDEERRARLAQSIKEQQDHEERLKMEKEKKVEEIRKRMQEEQERKLLEDKKQTEIARVTAVVSQMVNSPSITRSTLRVTRPKH